MKSIFPGAIDGDLLKLVHLSNSFRMVEGAKPLQVGDICRPEARIVSVINSSEGKIVKVKGHCNRNNQPVIGVLIFPLPWSFRQLRKHFCHYWGAWLPSKKSHQVTHWHLTNANNNTTMNGPQTWPTWKSCDELLQLELEPTPNFIIYWNRIEKWRRRDT